MPRHKARSHLAVSPENPNAVCGLKQPGLILEKFEASANKCQRCDRIAQDLPSTAGRKKIEGRYAIVLSGLSDDAVNWLEQLAAQGKAGATIGHLINENVIKIRKKPCKR